MKNLERGQGLVEYALILILLVVIVIVVGAILESAWQPAPQHPSLESSVQQTLDAYEQWVDTCVATERYDRETCEQLGLRGQ